MLGKCMNFKCLKKMMVKSILLGKGFQWGSLISEVFVLFPLSSKTDSALALFLSGNICFSCFRRNEIMALKMESCTT